MPLPMEEILMYTHGYAYEILKTMALELTNLWIEKSPGLLVKKSRSYKKKKKEKKKQKNPNSNNASPSLRLSLPPTRGILPLEHVFLVTDQVVHRPHFGKPYPRRKGFPIYKKYNEQDHF